MRSDRLLAAGPGAAWNEAELVDMLPEPRWPRVTGLPGWELWVKARWVEMVLAMRVQGWRRLEG